MITGQLKNKVDAIWNEFWSGGISNPLDIIEQITYLMFIHDLSEKADIEAKNSSMLGLPYKGLFSGENNKYRWEEFRQLDSQSMFRLVSSEIFPFMKTLSDDKNGAFAKYMANAIFKIPTPEKLVAIIDSMDELYKLGATLRDRDIMGDVYEYMLGKLATSGQLGQFRTPRHIIRMMVQFVNLRADDIICDPACGTAGFLVEASRYITSTYQEELNKREVSEHFNDHMFVGYDIDRTMIGIGAMNLLKHNIKQPQIEIRDSLSKEGNQTDFCSVILANPPFKGSINKSTIEPELLRVTNTTKTELLFLAQFLRSLKVGGRAAVIVPDGVLFGSSNAHQSIRKEIIEKHRLQAVISMPSGVFKPYAGVSTAILVFTKTNYGGTDNVWFYDMQADGFSLDDKRQEVKENDIPDIVERWKNLGNETDRKRTDKSFLVPKSEIVEKGYDLSINKYKEVVYEKENLPTPDEIVKKIDSLERQFREEFEMLKTILQGDN